MNPREKLATARLLAREKAPYFASALLALVPHEAPGLGTMGVTAGAILRWDPEAVAAWSAEETAGALVHEIGHLLRGHHQRLGSVLDRDAKLANLAMDIAQNPDVLAMGFRLPGQASKVVPDSYSMPANLSTEEYYHLLRKRAEKGQGSGKGGGAGGPSPSSKPAVGQGFCGGCAGRPMPGDPDDAKAEGRSRADVERVRRQVAEAIRAAQSKTAGSVPAGWAVWADTMLAPPKVRWQDKLSRGVRADVSYCAGKEDHTHRRPSRRQAGLGYGPGCPVMPSLHAPKPIVDFIVDTSGSMGPEEGSIVLRECAGAMRTANATVRITACDAAVHGKPTRVAGWREILPLLKGGGGTLFQPAFDAAMAQRPRPSLIIYATDGYNGDGVQLVQPPGVRVIWLLVGRSTRVPAEWGTVIRVD